MKVTSHWFNEVFTEAFHGESSEERLSTRDGHFSHALNEASADSDGAHSIKSIGSAEDSDLSHN